jgi:hypothetical protein
MIFPFILSAQIEKKNPLFKEIIVLDSMLFKAAFEDCDTAFIQKVMHPDCIFYHDQSGILPNKEAFLTGLKSGLCVLPYKATREVDLSTVEMFPMYNNGDLYGMLQNGIHRFYGQYPEKEKELTSTARFSHLWLKKDAQWQLANIISYDHH